MKISHIGFLLLTFVILSEGIASPEDPLRKNSIQKLVNSNSSRDDVIDGSMKQLFWEEVLSELKEFLKVKKRCPAKKYSCYPDGVPFENPPNKQLCSCDKRCILYGECCPDFISMMPHASRNLIQGVVCSHLDFWANNTSEGLLMVAQCPPAMRQSLIEASCLLQVPKESYTYALDVPVTSAVTNLTYRNYYCALCNDDAHNLVNINVTINCEKLQKKANFTLKEFMKELKYNPETKKFMNKSANCIFRVKEYQDVKAFASKYNGQLCDYPDRACLVPAADADTKSNKCPRQILLQQVRSCDPMWPIASDYDKCKAYSLKIFLKKDMVLYKNPHCAQCNFINLAETPFGCRIPTVFIMPPEDPSTYPPSFSILFKPNAKPKKCRRLNEVWNPLLHECTKIVCEEHFYAKAGQCVRDLYDENQNASESNVSCPKIAVESSNVSWFPNGSIMTKFDNKTHYPEDYELYNETVVLVCASNSLVYYESFTRNHSYVTFGVLVVSIVCLVFHIFLYLYLPSKKTWHERNLFCMCCALFMAQLLFLTATTATKYLGLCVFLASLLHYFWLASFFWMSVLSFDIWRTFKSKLSHFALSKNKIFKLYNLYAWGIPFLIVSLALIFDFSNVLPKYSPKYAHFRKKKLCWINKRKGLLIFFLIPVGVIILENILFFILTSFRIYRQTKEARFASQKSQSVRVHRGSDPNSLSSNSSRSSRNSPMRKNKLRFALYLKLSILQGLTWVTGFTASFANMPLSWYFFTIINGLQGAAIFLSFDLKLVTSGTVWQRFSKKHATLSDTSKYTIRATNSPNITSRASFASTPNQRRATLAHASGARSTIQLSTIRCPFRSNLTKNTTQKNWIRHGKANQEGNFSKGMEPPPIAKEQGRNLNAKKVTRIFSNGSASSSRRSLYVNEAFDTSADVASKEVNSIAKVIRIEAQVESST